MMDELPLDPQGGTDAPPGSARKILVMAQRAASGFCIFHPDDNPTADYRLRESYQTRGRPNATGAGRGARKSRIPYLREARTGKG